MKRFTLLFLVCTLCGMLSALPPFSVLSGGDAHGVAINDSLKLYVWGLNADFKGRHTLGVESEYGVVWSPKPIENMYFLEAVASGGIIVACTDELITYTWGNYGDTLIPSPMPVLAPEGVFGYSLDGMGKGDYMKAFEVAASSYSGFVRLGSQVVSWGYSDWNDSINPMLPTFILTEDGKKLTDITYMSACGMYALFMSKDGLLYSLGTLDDSSSVNYATLVLREDTGEPLTDVVSCGVSKVAAFAVTSDGSLWAWGNGTWGNSTGRGDFNDSNRAAKVLAGEYGETTGLKYLSNVKDVAGGNGFGMALMKDKKVMYWGRVSNGGGFPPFSIDSVADKYKIITDGTSPVFAHYCDEDGNEGRIVDDAVYLACGKDFGYILNSELEPYAFGHNTNGQLGLGDTTTIWSSYCFRPVKLPGNVDRQTDIFPYWRLREKFYVCPGDSVVLDSNFDIPIGCDSHYTFVWKKEEERLPFNSPSIAVSDTGVYALCVVYCGRDFHLDSGGRSTYTTVSYLPTPLEAEALYSVADRLEFHTALNEDYYTSSDDCRFSLFLNEDDSAPALAISNDNAGVLSFSIDRDNVEASVSSSGDTLYTVWMEDETVKTTEIDLGSPSSVGAFSNKCLLLTSDVPISLDSFSIYLMSNGRADSCIVTPKWYSVEEHKLLDFILTPICEGTPVAVELKNDKEEVRLKCNFQFQPFRTYALGLEFSNKSFMIGLDRKKTENPFSPIYPVPFYDNSANNGAYGVSAIGCVENNELVGSADYNCYYDLKFSIPSDYSCGRFPVRFSLSRQTAVNSVDSETATAAKGVYTISGLYLGEDIDVSSLPDGVYIINGEKRVVKR